MNHGRRVALTFTAACAASWCLPRAAHAASARPRTALVIGNARYGVAPLKNPGNDATLIAQALRGVGYSVQLQQNLKLDAMLGTIRQWIASAHEAESRVFYFAGHGAQFRGRNYILPVDAEIESEDDVLAVGVNASELADRLSRFQGGVNLVVLDACRNAPFPLSKSIRGARGRGLVTPLKPGMAPTEPPSGTVVAYSTSPGALALDGKGSNSAYARHLATHMAQPGLPVEAMFKRVRHAVAKETGNQQVPWEASSLVGDFCLVAGADGACRAVSAQ